MVANLSQLHQAVDDTQQVAAGQRGGRIAGSHVFLVQATLTLGQPAVHDVLGLTREVLLNLGFEPSK